MNILVCLKQVPDTNDIKWTENNSIDRSNLVSILNPKDDETLEFAKKIKSLRDDVNIIALSMGPIQAKEILHYAIARGASEAILISDKKFVASDTWATSYIISSAIKKLDLKPDFILCSTSAIDGETGQTPAGIAQFLGFPYLSCVSDFVRFYQNDNKVLVSQDDGNSKNMVEIEFPVVLAVDSDLEIQPPKVFDYIKSQNSLVSVYANDYLDINDDYIGLKGSKTLVKKAYKANSKRETTILSLNDGVSSILSSLNLGASDEN